MEYTHARCLIDVVDDFGIYNIKGKVYEITQLLEGNRIRIEVENNFDGEVIEIETTLDDKDFQFLILEE